VKKDSLVTREILEDALGEEEGREFMESEELSPTQVSLLLQSLLGITEDEGWSRSLEEEGVEGEEEDGTTAGRKGESEEEETEERVEGDEEQMQENEDLQVDTIRAGVVVDHITLIVALDLTPEFGRFLLANVAGRAEEFEDEAGKLTVYNPKRRYTSVAPLFPEDIESNISYSSLVKGLRVGAFPRRVLASMVSSVLKSDDPVMRSGFETPLQTGTPERVGSPERPGVAEEAAENLMSSIVSHVAETTPSPSSSPSATKTGA
jgi:hypothetical protein